MLPSARHGASSLRSLMADAATREIEHASLLGDQFLVPRKPLERVVDSRQCIVPVSRPDFHVDQSNVAVHVVGRTPNELGENRARLSEPSLPGVRSAEQCASVVIVRTVAQQPVRPTNPPALSRNRFSRAVGPTVAIKTECAALWPRSSSGEFSTARAPRVHSRATMFPARLRRARPSRVRWRKRTARAPAQPDRA